MALTSFPTITFNAGSGSDTQASGAGPSVAVYGTATATSSTSITLSFTSGDLSSVSQLGDHVIWISGVGFVRIDTHNGTDTVVVETSVNCTGANFAIGGKRATLDNAESRRLFAATTANSVSGASGRWRISLEDDQSISSAITCSFTAGNGHLVVCSSSNSALRTITQTANAYHFTCNTANKFHLLTLKFLTSHATKNELITNSSSTQIKIENCLVGDISGFNCPKGIAIRTGSQASLIILNTAIYRCTGIVINGACDTQVFNSEISRCSGVPISNAAATISIYDSILSYNGGDALVNTGGIPIVINSTFHGNNGNAINSANLNSTRQIIYNNCFTANSGLGIRFTGTFNEGVIENNCFGSASDSTNNTLGSHTGFILSSSNIAISPGYTNPIISIRDFSVSTAVKASGMPISSTGIAFGHSPTISYVDIGAAQRQESANIFLVTMME